MWGGGFQRCAKSFRQRRNSICIACPPFELWQPRYYLYGAAYVSIGSRRSGFQQHAVLGGEGDRDSGAFLEHLGRRAADGQLARRPVDNVLDEIAVEQALADVAGSRVRAAVWRSRGEIDIGGADRDPVFVAARRVHGSGLQQQSALRLE